MIKKILQEIFSNKLFSAFYLGWGFLHFCFYLISLTQKSSYKQYFWPISEEYWEKDLITIAKIYDLSEFVIYVGSPLVLMLIIKMLTDEKRNV
jgi:hypothetical protein